MPSHHYYTTNQRSSPQSNSALFILLRPLCRRFSSSIWFLDHLIGFIFSFSFFANWLRFTFFLIFVPVFLILHFPLTLPKIANYDGSRRHANYHVVLQTIFIPTRILQNGFQWICFRNLDNLDPTTVLKVIWIP